MKEIQHKRFLVQVDFIQFEVNVVEIEYSDRPFLVWGGGTTRHSESFATLEKAETAYYVKVNEFRAAAIKLIERA